MISIYKKNFANDYLKTAIDTAKWIDQYSVEKPVGKSWKISSGAGSNEGDDLANKMTDRSIYSGAAGVGFFYLQLYEATKNEEYLNEAIQAGAYLRKHYIGRPESKSTAIMQSKSEIWHMRLR